MKSKNYPFTVIKGRQEFPEIPDLADIYTMAYKSLQNLPSGILPHTRNIIVRIENYADNDVLKSLELEDKYDLLGLYRGIPLPLKTKGKGMILPDVIYLYRCPIIRFALENKEKIQDLVHHIMIHEIGHHFGYTDKQMEEIELEINGGHNRD